jgi:hypothetical protein
MGATYNSVPSANARAKLLGHFEDRQTNGPYVYRLYQRTHERSLAPRDSNQPPSGSPGHVLAFPGLLSTDSNFSTIQAALLPLAVWMTCKRTMSTGRDQFVKLTFLH